ncbi:hypothetical protein J6590_092081, partial [Homalodisca vitripennis]
MCRWANDPLLKLHFFLRFVGPTISGVIKLSPSNQYKKDGGSGHSLFARLWSCTLKRLDIGLHRVGLTMINSSKIVEASIKSIITPHTHHHPHFIDPHSQLNGSNS